ncbi:beta-lactamase-like protein 2 [Halteromyces radiatus]|uniref:beta-lactamase-like protein 2 n=1 Tax=Halteromyces radiatus TaxID=101107 RepID=UPI00221F165C|nr:beta-lactamase-like protein 2 [Halteromyces radiatus]KAI8099388.1 beta-lactamase-like protein 2 [Halteromyces radiatus]
MTETLTKLAPFTRLSDRVWRVLGGNPGRFTLQGTNTYLIGTGPRKLLLDCGEGVPDYVPLLEQSLQAISPQAYISDVIISHGHKDHFGGLEGILSTPFFQRKGIRVHKFPISSSSSSCSITNDNITVIDTADLGHLQHFPPDIHVHPLHDQQVFQTEGATLKVLHTPGHTQDHCTFWLEEEQSVFTADCILGQGTAVFEDLSAYLEGLRSILRLHPVRLYPGHGPIVEPALPKIKEYIAHREQREQQVLDFLNKPSTPMEIVQVLYRDYPASLHLPAAHSVLLHLLKLEKDRRVTWDKSNESSPPHGSWKRADLLSKKWHRL